jgi:hypothetical protein
MYLQPSSPPPPLHARPLSHTASYFLSRMNDPNIPAELRAWGHALIGAEIRYVPRKDCIGKIRRTHFMQGIRTQLHMYLDDFVDSQTCIAV